jgi:hypothetical protein
VKESSPPLPFVTVSGRSSKSTGWSMPARSAKVWLPSAESKGLRALSWLVFRKP